MALRVTGPVLLIDGGDWRKLEVPTEVIIQGAVSVERIDLWQKEAERLGLWPRATVRTNAGRRAR